MLGERITAPVVVGGASASVRFDPKTGGKPRPGFRAGDYGGRIHDLRA